LPARYRAAKINVLTDVTIEIQTIKTFDVQHNVLLENFGNCRHDGPPFDASSYRIICYKVAGLGKENQPLHSIGRKGA
jgi:hypothetical protein